MSMAEHISQDDREQGQESVRRIPGWTVSLLAVLAGNVLYYLAMPRLPEILQHKLFLVDWGLGLDFIFCVAAYIVARAILG